MHIYKIRLTYIIYLHRFLNPLYTATDNLL